MIGALFGLLLPAVAVWFLIAAFRLCGPRDSRALTAAIAVAAGIGLSSATTMALVALRVGFGPAFLAIDTLLWGATAVLAWRHVRRSGIGRGRLSASHGTAPRQPLTAADWAVRLAFAAIAIAALAAVTAEYLASPHGQWDAWAIWNQKARFLVRGGEHWTAMLAIDWANPSHPILVSASVARLWTYAGAELTALPALLSIVFGAAIVAAIVGALDPRRRRAWIAGSVVMAPGTFSQLVAAQTADLPVGLFILLTLIVLRRDRVAAWSDAHAARAALILAGVLSGLSAWTKNEGLVFIVIATLLVLWIAARHGGLRQAGWWAAGAAPLLLTVAWYKLAIAPAPPEYFADGGSTASFVDRLVDGQRHALVGSLIERHWTAWGGPLARGSLPLVMVAAALAAVTGTGRFAGGVLATAVLMLAGYYAVWVLSPIDTAWLVATTFDRLLMQLWPALVLAAFSAGDRGATAEATAGAAA